MKSLSQFCKDQTRQALEQHFFRAMEDEVHENLGLLEKLYQKAISLDESAGFLARAEHKRELHHIIADRGRIRDGEKLDEHYAELNQALTDTFDQLPDWHRREQLRERFYPQEHDQFRTRLQKFIKRTRFRFIKLPLYVTNLFRKLFKYKPYKIHYWKHDIPVRRLAELHFRLNIIESLLAIRLELFRESVQAFLRLKKWEERKNNPENFNEEEPAIEGFELKEIRGKLDEILKEGKDKLAKDLEVERKSFEHNYLIAGTLEMPLKKLSDKAISQNFGRASRGWQKETHQWKNTLFGLFDEWRSDLEIYELKNKSKASFEEFCEARRGVMDKQLKPALNRIDQFVERQRKEIKSSDRDFKKVIQDQVQKVNAILEKELIDEITEKLSSKLISGSINDLEESISDSVEDLAEERAVVKGDDYDHGFRDSELAFISPLELISFESLPRLKNGFQKAKSNLFQILEKAHGELDDLDHMVSFGLNSSLTALDRKEKDLNEAKEIALESLQRANNRVSDIEERLEDELAKIEQQLDAEINRFTEGIQQLTVNENVAEIKLRISKAKAIQQSKEYRLAVLRNLKSLYIRSFGIFRDGLKKGKSLVEEARRRFLMAPKSTSISKEATVFLSESESIIDGLPLIYRRLYKIEPVEDMGLFVGRKKELDLFTKAFDHWKTEKYASCMIIGEKWCGATSFINYALYKQSSELPLLRHAVEKCLSREEDFTALTKSIFSDLKFDSLDQLADQIRKGPRKIVVLEDVHHLFLRRVGGMEAFDLLTWLISETYDHIFWICSCTQHAWNYLVKVVGAHDSFSDEIELEEISDEQIVEIVSKRNRISGYRIQFIPDQRDLENKKFNKLSDSEKQEYLKKRFFSELNDFARSNISLALTFWLLSTKEVDSDMIKVGSFEAPDLSFVSMLSLQKVYALHALVLHDGLSVPELAEAINQPEDDCRKLLTGLLEDGIVRKEANMFFVNLMIYRNALSLLKSKNLIH